jgi:hypothetical protein
MPKRDAAKVQPEPVRDIDALRGELLDKLEAFVRQHAWQSCKRPPCKRARACRAGRGAECEGLPAQPEPTPEQWDKTRFFLKRALERRLGELRRGGE